MQTRIMLAAFLVLACFAFAHPQTPPAGQFPPFNQKEYYPKAFNQSEYSNGSARIRIAQAKGAARDNERPLICRAWLEVANPKQTTFRKYFDDMDPVGFSYGLFVPEAQPPAPYFAVVKTGDYDGRLYLVNQDAKTEDLMGGFYFITGDKRFLFSQYATDGAGLVVFDLKEGRAVYSSDRMPYIHQWYFKDGVYLFTESEWIRSNLGKATEKAGVAHFYDFNTHRITAKQITAAELAAAKKLSYDFDPRELDNCTTGTGKRLAKSRKDTDR